MYAIAPRSKIEPILTDSEFAKRYHIQAMPPKTFTDKLLACMNAKSKTAKMDTIKAFYNYVMRAGGGIDPLIRAIDENGVDGIVWWRSLARCHGWRT